MHLRLSSRVEIPPELFLIARDVDCHSIRISSGILRKKRIRGVKLCYIEIRVLSGTRRKTSLKIPKWTTGLDQNLEPPFLGVPDVRPRPPFYFLETKIATGSDQSLETRCENFFASKNVK